MGEAWRRIVASGIVDRPNPRCGEQPSAGLREGIRLFNDGEFFECHEVLEDIWRAESDPLRYLYQGILQIGVGFHHLRNNNHRGAVSLLSSGIDKVRRFEPTCLSIDTSRLADEAQRCLDDVVALGRERLREFDWSQVPTVHIEPTETAP